MTTFKHILVPVDLSENAVPIVEWAAKLAADNKAELHLLHVVERPAQLTPAYVPPFAGYAVMYDDLIREGREKLDRVAAAAGAAGVRFERTLVLGNAVEEILKRATEVQADAIVMATHGRQGLERLLLGSTTEGVTRSATIPVITLCPAALHSAATA